MAKNWNDALNEIGDVEQAKHGRTYDQQTREIVEYMIMFLDRKKIGDEFLKFYKAKLDEEES